MKTRGLSLLLALVMVLGLLSAPAQAAEGTEEISSQAQLAEMTDGGSYILTADIVLSEWEAISFSGSLNGNGHTITLSGTPLFDTLTGTVKNLLLDGSVSDSKNAGALAYSVTGGTVQNCWSGASVSVGYIATPAGFAGKLTGGVIKSCLSTSPLKSYDKGIASTADASARISNCYWLSASSPSGGSFAGEDNQKITADDYLVAMANLNAAHEEGLLYWTMGQDGMPRPTSETAPEVERTQLDQAISQAAALREEEYTPRSWSALEAALQSAQAVGQDATQAEVNAAAKALTDAMAALVVRGDKTALEELCNSVRDKTDAVSGEEGICYTAESWAAFADARTAANAVLEDENADERQVLNAREDLQQALEGLIPDRTGVTAEERAALGGEMEKAPVRRVGTFAPGAPASRAMLTTVLYRLESPASGEQQEMPFADVAQDAWYAGAVAWAGENGIVNGVGGGVFAPGKAITREQMVTMLYRYACYRGEATGAAGDLKQFADGEEVSAWAVEAMSWAVGAGLVSGVAPQTLAPGGTATRAQMAAILMAFIEMMK